MRMLEVSQQSRGCTYNGNSDGGILKSEGAHQKRLLLLNQFEKRRAKKFV